MIEPLDLPWAIDHSKCMAQNPHYHKVNGVLVSSVKTFKVEIKLLAIGPLVMITIDNYTCKD